jgi:hypothetical protein
MAKTLKLTDKELKDIGFKIAHPTFEFMKKIITKELDTIVKEGTVDMNTFVNLVVIALSSLDTNILIMTRNAFLKVTGNELDFVKLMNIYLGDLTSIMDKDDLARLKEKMN